MPDDIYYMRRALRLAEKGRATVSPNPMVGCVIVKNGRIIAEGWHRKYGADHAEINALRKAGTGARGSVMYVTLEPCAHWGHTPPCVDALLAAGLKRVVVAMADPNRQTNGRSLVKLRKAGIDVSVGVCEDEARVLNAVFIKFISKRLPFAVAKTAQTLDGKIATRGGGSKWITSEEARTFARNRRNEFDAILVGVSTVIADDPSLDAPFKSIRKVVVDSGLRIPEKAALFKGARPGQVIVAVTGKAGAAKRRRLEKRGVCVIVCPQNDGRVDLKALFKALAKIGIASILIEGGAAVIGSALKAGLIDVLNVYIAPRIIGDVLARSSVVGLDVLKISRARNFNLMAIDRLGPDILLTLKA